MGTATATAAATAPARSAHAQAKDEFFAAGMYMFHITGFPQQPGVLPGHVDAPPGARLDVWRTDPADGQHIPGPGGDGVLFSTPHFSLANSGNRTLHAPKRSWKITLPHEGGRDTGQAPGNGAAPGTGRAPGTAAPATAWDRGTARVTATTWPGWPGSTSSPCTTTRRRCARRWRGGCSGRRVCPRPGTPTPSSPSTRPTTACSRSSSRWISASWPTTSARTTVATCTRPTAATSAARRWNTGPAPAATTADGSTTGRPTRTTAPTASRPAGTTRGPGRTTTSPSSSG